MLTPAEAEIIVRSQLPLLPVEDCPLDAATGRVLRTDIVADRDMPPYDRATMDGYALRAAAVDAGVRHFRITGLQVAGTPPLTVHSADECLEIATGALRPLGTDAVVPYERTRRDGNVVSLAPEERPVAGDHLHARGSDASAGTLLVAAGSPLGGESIAVAAACGQSLLKVAARPRVVVVATGDELVEIATEHPAPHQIRRSNDLALRAALIKSGVAEIACRHLPDQVDEIERGLARLLEDFDVVILTGGVSKGRLDHVPGVLARLGVENRIHGVAQRPGKPFWFGVSQRQRPVFALPGNPVSSYVCLHRYVLPALAQMSGAIAKPPPTVVLGGSPLPAHATLTRFIPVAVESAADGRLLAHPRLTNTSGDFAALVGTDGFVEVPPGDLTSEARLAFWRWA